MDKKERQLNSYFLYLLMYIPLGAVCPLIGQYLSSIGFTGTQVGIVTSCATATAVFAGLIMGRIYANANCKRLVVAIMFILSAIGSITARSIKSFIPFVLIYSFIYFFQGPSHGLCDSMTIQNGKNFAGIRAFGAIGYATASYFSGLLSDSKGLSVIFIIHAVAFALAAIVIMTEKEPPKISHNNKEKVSAFMLIHEKGFLKLLLVSFFSMGTIMANNTYFSYLFKEAGGSLTGIGTAFLLMAGSEAVFMTLLPIARKKLPTEKLLPVGLIIAVLRFLLFSSGPSTKVLLGTFFLQGMMNGIILVEIVRYFEKIVKPEYANISVSTYYALGNNLPAIVCNLIGGILLDAFSAKAVYFVFAIMNLIAILLYFLMKLNKIHDRQIV